MTNHYLKDLNGINRKLEAIHKKQMFVEEHTDEYRTLLRDEIRLMEEKNRILDQIEKETV
ncbi:hypothetical protein ANABIO32_02560 [Rossellomorea marisflavi]|uniref:hypothetical protein n=1 Tax=Rossellomorea marisflavi TaxID=189381 RepID=UPI0025C84B5E|nr:hypothetical protein [Rossellomorea marisflavi]GLI82569.1 hypothetical protein ANABIO32_02560 [Rossellomorea marisflavi]